MNHRTVRKLTDLEIDEVSLVDRPANQHGLVAFAKRHGEDNMTIYDADGVEVYENELEHGDVVYDDSGAEFVFVEEDADDTTAELQSGHDYEDEDDFADEPQLVGKAGGGLGGIYRGTRTAVNRGARNARQSYNDASDTTRRRLRGGALAGGGVTAFGTGRMSKSLGQSVYDELSKALTSDDRDQVISKAMDRVSKAEARAAAAEEAVAEIASERELETFIDIAKSYGLPVDPYRLGSILKSAAATMDDEDLAELDRLLTSQGEIYEELGSDLGLNESSIHGQIQAMALETVGKADVSLEQATVALYEANPAAYDEYLQEG